MWKRNKPFNLRILQMCSDLLQTVNIFPNDKIYGSRRFLKFFGPAIIFGFPLLIGNAGYLYITLDRKLWPEQLNSIVILVQLLTALCVIIHSFVNWENKLMGLERMDRYDFGEPANCRKLCRWYESKIMWIYYSIKIFCFLYGSYHFLNHSYCTNTGLKGDPGYVCGIPMPLWFPFKANYFLVKLSLNFCLLLFGAKYLPALNVVAMTKVIESTLTIRRIQDFINIIKDAKKNHLINKKYLHLYILRHFEIIDCIDQLNAYIGYGLFPIYFFLPLLLALFIYQIFINQEIIAVMALLPWQISILSLCYLGERLSYEGNCLWEAVYDLPWYDLDPKCNKTFHIFLGRLQQPLKIKVKPFTEMNFIYIFQMLKGTYSFLVYLKQGKDRKQQ